MNCTITEEELVSPYLILFKSLCLIPFFHYLFFLFLAILLFLYLFLEIHFPRSDPISLTFNPNSDLCQFIVSKCRLLHGRYFPTIWLSSPHLQTAFLSLFGNSPPFCYKRNLFQATDGGTIALDWLMHSDVVEGISQVVNGSTPGNDRTPIAIVVPGLTSDSTAAYIKHLAFRLAKEGWNVVVSNHRGLGGISLTSDCVYNAGWTEDLRKVIDHIHSQFPEAPLFAVGTSIGANVLVKYLGEDGTDTPLVGATAVCSPWDLLICDRFINRKLVQKLYDRVLTVGLQGYAQLHHSIISRIADWEGIKKSRSVREFDNYATRLVAKFETTDAYYRHSSSAQFVGNVGVPLLCISALDDPVCTREAIPWDECSVFILTQPPISASCKRTGLFIILYFQTQIIPEPLESSIDQGPYIVETGEDGLVAAAAASEVETTRANAEEEDSAQIGKTSYHLHKDNTRQGYNSLIGPLMNRVDQLSRYSRKSVWLLAYIAIVSTWPLLGPALLLSIKKRFRRLTKKLES
ncbi:hypothetical protein DY000_02015596 [Brassica cretica]|uniref:Serine aminopeptidase S33 domain-containing protein n=1 Tax=Brassica cretica TaxID=69181 RepID=A0ABQ7CXB8_BRACR|nr:hypothetical protein DY000_02015596 [Brassica cretica]